MNFEIKKEMIKAIENATRKACMLLFKEHDENFYYCALITGGEGQSPILCAWSYEALERECLKEADSEKAKIYFKWSYADTPYFAYGEEYFEEVEKIFDSREMPFDDDNKYMKEYELRLECMEKALANLDKEGLFGKCEKRKNIVINVEVMPPDYTNIERAKRLNPEEALVVWFKENAAGI